MSALGVVALGTEAIAGQLLRVPPVVQILAVTPFPTTVGTVTWAYSSLANRPQIAARVKVYAPSDLTVLYDSGVISGADTAWNIPLTVAASTSYFVAVSVYDGFDWSDETKVLAESGNDNILPYKPLASVGRTYECAINGVGYMLSDGVDDLKYKRVLQNLQPSRFATTATPFAENVQHYTLIRFMDFSGGAGQLFRDRKSSNDTAFYDSEGCDPWTPGQVTLLHNMATSTPPIGGGRAAVYSNNLVMRSAGLTGLLTFTDPTNPVLYFENFRSGLGAWTAYNNTQRPPTNNSVSRYDPTAVTTDASGAHITATNNNDGTFKSGIIDTLGKLSFQSPVRIEGRIRMPHAQGFWPAFWLLPTSGLPWPTGGEIDIMESPSIDGKVYGTIHGDNPYGSKVHWQQGSSTTCDVTQYHVYALDWTSTGFTWYVDGVPYFTCDHGPNSPKPFDAPFYLILNFAVGGTWPGNPDGTTPSPAVMDIDYVKVTAINDSTVTSGTTTSFPVGAYSITDLCSDGTYWYACDPAHGIRRNNTAADPGVDWSTQAARVIEYAGGRICAAVDATGTANRFTTLGPAGTEEVTGGRLTVPTGWQITGFTGGGGFVWFGAKSGDRGSVYAWQAGSTNTPFVAMDLPAGQWVESVFYYLGNVFVRAGVNRSTSGKTGAVIYRCVPDSAGALTPTRVTDIGVRGPEGNYAQGNFSASDKYVFFTWSNMTTTGLAGVGCVNLETGGYCRWVYGQAMATPYTIVWRNRVVITDVGALSIQNDSTYLGTGWLTTSVSDLDASLDKVLDSVTLTLSVNDGTQSVGLEASFDGNKSSVDPGIGMLGPGTLTAELPWGERTKAYGLKFNLTHVSGGSEFLGATVRLHPLGVSDEVVQLPINCADRITDLKGTYLPEASGPGKGALRARALLDLSETRVLFQDVDYAITKVAAPYDVVDAEVRSVGVYNDNLGMQQRDYVVVLTLRKRSK